MRQIPAPSTSPIPPCVNDPTLLADFIVEARELLDEATAALVAVEGTHDRKALETIFRVFHTIKGIVGFLAFDDIEAIARAGEDLAGAMRARSGPVEQNEAVEAIRAALDLLHAFVDEVAGAMEEGRSRRPLAVASYVQRTLELALAADAPSADRGQAL
ncbi:MAG: Hpt domain-containing protein [Deltaproteobacteria bacterium]|nr:Hpt domain-containing protein [Deltaproteobacteria bacterium]